MYQQHQERVSRLIDVYNKDPNVFDDKQLEELQALAQEQGVEFHPKTEESSLFSMAGNFTAGLFEGFTTISVGDEPRSTGDKIAHSLGHLAGFAPGIIAAPLSLGAKALSKLGQKGAAKVLTRGAQVAQKMNEYSVPMMGGGLAQRKFESGLAKAGLEAGAFMKGTATRSIAEQAVHLGAASAVSSIWKGPSEMFNAGVHGALAGGAFGGIGNFTRLGNIIKNGTPAQVDNAEKVLRTTLGASIQGLPSVLADEPIEMILYNTLLGGYFGYGSQPAFKQEGRKFISKLQNEPDQGIFFTPSRHENWGKVTKETQDFIYDGVGGVNEMSRKYVLRNRSNEKVDLDKLTQEQIDIDAFIVNRARSKFNTNTPTKDQINLVYREEGLDIRTGKSGGYEYDQNIDIPYDNVSDYGDPVEVTKFEVANDLMTNKPEYVISLNDGIVNTTKKVGEYHGKLLGKKAVDIPADKIETFAGEEGYGSLAYIHKMETNSKGELESKMHKIFSSKTDFDKNILIPHIKPNDFYLMQEHLHAGGKPEGKYIYGGIKDKGLVNIRDYHLMSDTISSPDLIRKLATKDGVLDAKMHAEIMASFKESERLEFEFLGIHPEKDAGSQSHKFITEAHSKAWKSNVLIEAERNGYLQNDSVHRLMESGHSKSVVDWNKREQLYHDKSFPLQLEGNYNYTILSDRKLIENSKVDHGNTDLDGTVFYHPDVYKEINGHLNLPMTSMNKPVMIAPMYGKTGGREGVMAVKSAGRVADGPMLDYMNQNQLNMVIMDSSAKHYGEGKRTELNFDGKSYSSEAPDVRVLRKNDVRINLGTKEDPKSALKPQQIVKQLFGGMNGFQNKGMPEHVIKNYYEPGLKGNAKVNDMMAEYINTGKGDLSKINPENVGVKELWEVITNENPTPNQKALKKHLLEKIHNIEKLEGIKENIAGNHDGEGFTSADWALYVERNNRILELGGMGDGVRKLFKYTRKHDERVLMKHLLTRYINPKYKYSAKAWLSPVLPHENLKFGEGEFMADGAWNPNVIYKNKEMKLDKLWGKYEKAKGQEKKDIEDALEFTSIRVPADSVSGVRILKFRGFTNSKDGISVHTKDLDNNYLGGADKDSDSAFFYQGFDAKTKESFRKNKYEWQEGNTSDGRYIEGKNKDHDKFFYGDVDSTAFEGMSSKFSPSMRKMVARNAAGGQIAIGAAVKSRLAMLGYANQIKDAGTITIPIKHKFPYNRRTKERNPDFGSIEISLKPGGEEIIRRLGREMLNRSADAADYPSMIPFHKFKDMYLRAAFNTKVIKNQKVIDAHNKYQEAANAKARATGGKEWSLTKIPDVLNYGLASKVIPEMKLASRLQNAVDKTPKKWDGGERASMNFLEFEAAVREVIDSKGNENIQERIIERIYADGTHRDVSLWGNLTKLNQLNDFLLQVASDMSTGVHYPKMDAAFRKDLAGALFGGAGNKNITKFFDELAISEKPEQVEMWGPKGMNQSQKRDFALDSISNDLFRLSTFNKIFESGFKAYQDLMTAGLTRPEARKIIPKILKPISEKAIEIKRTFENVEKTADGELIKADLTQYDAQVLDFKNTVLDPASAKNKIKPNLLRDYFDYWLMSPNISTKGKDWYDNLRDGGVSRIPLQSEAVENRAIKGVFKDFNRMYTLATEAQVDLQATKAMQPAVREALIHNLKTPSELIHDSITELAAQVTKPEPKAKAEPVKAGEPVKVEPSKNLKRLEGEAFKLEDVVMNDADIATLKELRDNIEKFPHIADAMHDWFPAFHYEVNGVHKEYDAMNMADVKALNMHLADLNSGVKKWGTKVPRWIFRADPRTIDEHMSAVSGNLKKSFNRPVLQKDGSVKKRDIDVFTSAIGSMKEFNRRVQKEESTYLSEIEGEMNNRLDFRKNFSVEDSSLINDLVIMKREGVSYKDTDAYISNKDKKFTITEPRPKSEKKITLDGKVLKVNMNAKKTPLKKKEFTLDQVVDKADREYTKILTEVSEKWLHSKGKENKDFKWEGDAYIKYKGDNVDINHFFRKALEPATKGYKLDIVPIETLLRFNYEYNIQKKIADGSWKKSATEFRKKYKFEKINKRDYKEYFPHMNFGATEKARFEIQNFKEARIKRAHDEAIAKGKPEKEALEAAAIEALKWDMVKESGDILSKGIARDVIDAINTKIDMVELAKNNEAIGLNKRTQNILDRQFDMPGYDRSPFVIDAYKESIVRNHYKLLQASMGNFQIDRFIKEGKFGKDTNDWAFALREYLKNSLGHQTTFAEDIRTATDISKRMEDILKGSMYYKMSDHRVIKGWDKVDGWFKRQGWKTPFSKNMPEITASKTESPELYAEQVKARKEYQTRIIHELGRKEAKFQLMTLLANSGTATANMFGGTTMTISQGGLRNFKRANSKKWLTDNIITDYKGNNPLVLKSGHKVKDVKQLKKWIAEQGVIDNFIQDELQLNTEWSAQMSKNTKNTKNFFKKAKELIKNDPNVKDETLIELAKRYNINKALLKGGAFFMSASERKLRMDAFLTHALQFRDSFGSSAKDLPLSDPAVIEAGLKGIEATQFLYHSAFRPAYMRTSLGKVMTRFKLFVFQSLRTRKELYKRAKYYGFEPNTEAFEKFKNLFVADMMTMALGTAFSYSLFDTALPPPWDWIQETSSWLFGDKKEREQAFFGQYPYPIAPLQVVTPPIARIPMSIFSSLINQDWDRFMDYQLHTMYPFGRMVRQIDQTVDEPYGSTLGRGMQQFFRIPGDKIKSKIDKAAIRKMREQLVEEELDF